MSNFDYKKYLAENKLTSNSRMLNEEDGTYTQVEKDIKVDELFGFGGAKATEKDSIRLDVRGGSIICKPIVRAGTGLKIEKNDSDFDHIRVGDVIRIVKSLNITAGKPFYLGTTEVIVDKLFLNGTETKSVTLPS